MNYILNWTTKEPRSHYIQKEYRLTILTSINYYKIYNQTKKYKYEFDL